MEKATRFWKGLAAAAAAVATLTVPLVPAWAGGGGGNGGDNHSGEHSGQFAQSWAYRDNNDGGFGGATREAVLAAAGAMGVTMGSGASAWKTADEAVAEANHNCLARFDEAHADQRGEGRCRMVAVGMVTTPGKVYQGLDRAIHDIWMGHWRDTVAGMSFSNNGAEYVTADIFQDQPGASVDMIADQYAGDENHGSIVVIMLNQYEPRPGTYALTVSTDQVTPGPLKVGSMAAVQDLVHASGHGGAIREDLDAVAVLHREGRADGYVKAAQAVKRFRMKNQGDTEVSFTPAELGVGYWLEGTYWFDVQVPKQGRMEGAVDTPDRDPRETFTVSSVPPPPPVKRIQKGTSADGMVNHTVITTGTGLGGYELHMRDSIDPHGVGYKVENLQVKDTTEDRDLSGEFVLAWDSAAHLVTADRAPDRGAMPLEHVYEFSFDVKVSKPDFSKVTDHASVVWNHNPSVETGAREFPTWRPQPDKSWIRRDPESDRWEAVIDPSRTNATGADDRVFLDGDRVGSVVNATLPAHLVQSPARFEIKDDWTRASYIFKADPAADMHVYQAEAGTDRWSSVSDIVSRGRDVTGMFDIEVTDGVAVARAKPDYLTGLKGMETPLQVTLLIPGTVDFARGKGASQVRRDHGVQPGGELTFCTAAPTGSEVSVDPPRQPDPLVAPLPTGAPSFRESVGRDTAIGQASRGKVHAEHPALRDAIGMHPGIAAGLPAMRGGGVLLNRGSETVNAQKIGTNEPKICGYVPPVKKDVVSEASQGGDQGSVDGKVVYPGQRVEYQLTTQPRLPIGLAYDVKSVKFTDRFDRYLNVDKQTLELMDLGTGSVIPKTRYATVWDDKAHMVQVVITDKDLVGQWKAAANPRIQMRFEGTVSQDAPVDHKVGNRWMLTVNNSLTPSNEVINMPSKPEPVKQDVSSKDRSVSIDGRTLLLGDTGVYRVTLDARQTDNAYKVWKLGIMDDFEEEYLAVDPAKIEVQGSDGRDYTQAFNIQILDGVAYAFAKRVDTKVPATGEIVKGDPQPGDLRAYASSDRYDPLGDPAIDQSLLGRTYDLVLPYRVVKVRDGHTVKNTATQITDDVRRDTNQVSNPLKPLNPAKDVVIEVGGGSLAGRSVYLDGFFLYQLDSSILPAGRAYPKTDRWLVEDRLETSVDHFTGQWAVYATRDLYREGRLLAAQGERLAGSGYDSSRFGGPLFTMDRDSSGRVSILATDAYLALVSAAGDREAGWRAYLQCRRLRAVDRQENRFTEYYNDKVTPSNLVWTRTPDMTPRLHIEKFDTKSGFPEGDRDEPGQALAVNGEVDITFRISNRSGSDPDKGQGPVFRAKDLRLEDITVAGGGRVTDIRYPQGWEDLVLEPGGQVDVHGILRNVTGHHTDRAKVTGVPLTPCPTPSTDPFGTGRPGGDPARPPVPAGSAGKGADDRDLCRDAPVESNTDDWNGLRPESKPVRPLLSKTGGDLLPILLIGLGALISGAVALLARFRDRRGRAYFLENYAEPALRLALHKEGDVNASI